MEDCLINLIVPNVFFCFMLLLLLKPFNISHWSTLTLTVNPDLVCHEQWLSKSARASPNNVPINK